jgi:hypothetical protein
VHNTLVSERPHSLLVTNHGSGFALVANNLVQGDVQELMGHGETLANLVLPKLGLRDPGRYDYRLQAGAIAIDGARGDLTTQDGRPLNPSSQYRHPCAGEPRPDVGLPDIGAFEYDPRDRGAISEGY